MKASPADQLRLVELADLDAVIDRADHARRNPVQGPRVQELIARRQTESAELTRLLGIRDDARGDLGRLESDVAVVDARAARDAERLATTSSVKDVEALEREIAALAKRKSDLEDAELEVMERVESADAEVSAQEALIATIVEEGARVSAEGKAAVADATARWEAAGRDRAALAAQVPTDLLARYDTLAARGTGAALLRQRTCEGCRMVLSGTDLAALRLAAPDDVVTCPECGCILVRGEDSGL